VGIREFKTHLSRYVRRVKKGEALALTEHGKTVATITPATQSPSEEKVWDLVRRGIIDWSGGKIDWQSRRLVKLKGKSMSDTIIELRREARY